MTGSPSLPAKWATTRPLAFLVPRRSGGTPSIGSVHDDRTSPHRIQRPDPGCRRGFLDGRRSGEEGPLAALVNNAAIGLDKPLRDTTGDDWKRLMDVNLRSAFQCVREARRFLAAANGAVVNVGSVHAIATSANAAVYAVTKGALCALTRAAALELAADGVRCNAPGAVDTPMLRDRLSRRPRGARGEFPGSGRPDAARLRRLARADRSDHPLPRGRRTDALRDRAGGRRRRDAPARDRVTARTVRAPSALAVAAPFSTMDAKVRAAAEHFIGRARARERRAPPAFPFPATSQEARRRSGRRARPCTTVLPARPAPRPCSTRYVGCRRLLDDR